MKGTAQLILFLTLFILSLLPACGGQPSTEGTTTPNANDILKFNEEGIAVLRGYLAGESISPATNGILSASVKIDVPAKVEGIKTNVAVSLPLRYETETSSSLKSYTNVREVLTYYPDSPILKAFPAHALVDITLLKKDATFEVQSIQEVTQKFTLFQKRAVINHVFSTDVFSRATVIGSIREALKQNDGTILWTVSIPIEMQGIEAAIILPMRSASDTEIITSNGNLLPDASFPWGHLQIQFTRRGETLTARKIIVLP